MGASGAAAGSTSSRRGQVRLAVDPRPRVHRRPHRTRPVGRVDRVDDHRQARETPDHVRLRDETVPELHLAEAVVDGLGPQHQVRKVHVPLVRRDVGALGHVAEVAEVALLDDLSVIGAADPVHLHRLALVDEIEKGREGVAEAHAAPAAVADVEDPLQLRKEGLLVVERGVAPVDRMASGRFEAALADALPHPAGRPGGGAGGRSRLYLDGHGGLRGGAGTRRGGGAAACAFRRHLVPLPENERRPAPPLRRLSSLRHPARRGPSGSGWHGTVRPLRGSRTSPRSPRAPRRGRSSPCRGTCPCTRGSHPRSRP